MKKLMLIVPVLAGVLWGSAGIFVRTLSAAGFGNCTITFSRFAVAAVMIFIGIMAVDRSMLKIKPKDIWVFIICGIFGMMGLNLCYNKAIDGLTLSLAAVLLSMSPVFVMFMASIILHERVTLKKVGCTALAVAGCVLVSGALEAGGADNITVLGTICGIAAAFFYAVYSIFSKVAMKQRYNVFTIIFYSLVTSAIVLAPFVDWRVMGDFVAEAPAGHSLFMLLNSLCTSVLPYVLFTVSLSYVDTGKVSILAAGGEPSAAMIFGIVAYSEVPSVLSLCGLVVTIIAIWLLLRPDKPQVNRVNAQENAAELKKDGEETCC